MEKLKTHFRNNEEYQKLADERLRRLFDPELDERAQNTPEMDIPMNI